MQTDSIDMAILALEMRIPKDIYHFHTQHKPFKQSSNLSYRTKLVDLVVFGLKYQPPAQLIL